MGILCVQAQFVAEDVTEGEIRCYIVDGTGAQILTLADMRSILDDLERPKEGNANSEQDEKEQYSNGETIAQPTAFPYITREPAVE